jgi:Effector Associated Constant Component 1
VTDAYVSIEAPPGTRPADVDRLCTGLTDDLRQVRGVSVKPAEGWEPGGKSGTGIEIGKLVIGGVFSTATVQALARVLVAYINRTGARSIRIRRGDTEVVLTGAEPPDAELLAGLSRLLEAGEPDR